MLRDLDSFLRAGIISRFRLQHHTPGLNQTRSDNGGGHDPKGEQDILHGHISPKQSPHHAGDGWNLECFKKCLQHAKQYRCSEFSAVFLSAEGKKPSDDLNHCLSPPYVPSTFSHTDHGGQASPHGYLLRESGHLSPHKSGQHL